MGRDVAMVGSDAVSDVKPSGFKDIVEPVHQLLLVAMGTPLFDNLRPRSGERGLQPAQTLGVYAERSADRSAGRDRFTAESDRDILSEVRMRRRSSLWADGQAEAAEDLRGHLIGRSPRKWSQITTSNVGALQEYETAQNLVEQSGGIDPRIWLETTDRGGP